MEDVLPLLELWLARAQEPLNLKVRIEDSLCVVNPRNDVVKAVLGKERQPD